MSALWLRRDQLRRHHRPEPQLCRPQPRQPRRDAQPRRRLAAPRRGAAGHRQDARQPRARADAGHPPAPCPARPSLAGEPRHRLCRRRAASSGAGAVRLGDVGGQCRDRLARARHRRRPLPPHRRQPRDHAAPQPRMARTRWRSSASPSPTRPFAVHDPVPAPFGDEGAANHMRLAPGARRAGRRNLRLWRRRRPLPRPPASRGERSGRAPPRARSGAHAVRPAIRAKRSRRAPSTTMSSRSPTSACCSRTNRPSPTRTASTPIFARAMPEVEIVEVPAAEVSLADAIALLSVQRPAGDAARRARWR